MDRLVELKNFRGLDLTVLIKHSEHILLDDFIVSEIYLKNTAITNYLAEFMIELKDIKQACLAQIK